MYVKRWTIEIKKPFLDLKKGEIWLGNKKRFIKKYLCGFLVGNSSWSFSEWYCPYVKLLYFVYSAYCNCAICRQRQTV